MFIVRDQKTASENMGCFNHRALLRTQKSRLSKFLKFEFTPVNEYFNFV